MLRVEAGASEELASLRQRILKRLCRVTTHSLCTATVCTITAGDPIITPPRTIDERTFHTEAWKLSLVPRVDV